jgi:hypothetical protein
MPLGRSLLLAMLVGAAANPQAGLPPERLRLPAAIGVPMTRRTLADVVRTAKVATGGIAPTCRAGRKMLRAAIRARQKGYLASMLQSGFRQRQP